MHKLIDAEARHRENPDTFEIPSLEDRENLQPGWLVKLILEPGERLWFEVIECYRAGAYVGKLRNTPVGHVGVRHGDSIVFHPKHVAALHKSDNDG